MINFDGMKAEASKAGYPMLPAGPYVAKITGVHIDGEAPNQSLIVRVDISEGEYANYFTKRYQNDSNGKYPAKYKGDYRLRIPHPASNSQYPESDKRKFNDAIYRIETSNPGFKFDGDENKFVGKTVGINMQAGTYNDAPYTTIGRFETADDVRKGLVKEMKEKPPRFSPDYHAQQAAPAPAPGGFQPVEDVDIPF